MAEVKIANVIATVINFSTNEAVFLGQCLKEALIFSDQVIAIVCDHFFDGTPEDQELLFGIYQEHPETTFIQYGWSEEGTYSNHSSRFRHNLSRLVALHFLKDQIDYVLFLDVDEIAEGSRFANWLETFPYREYEAIRLACYWYFREASLRANEIEDTPLLIRKNCITYDNLMQVEERKGMHDSVEGKKLRFAEKGDPLFHHYSWVRPKEGLLKKAKTWGHRGERNWEELIEKEFSAPFSGTDFVHGYTFTQVDSPLIPSTYTRSHKAPSNVTFLSARDVHKIDLALRFGDPSIFQTE